MLGPSNLEQIPRQNDAYYYQRHQQQAVAAARAYSLHRQEYSRARWVYLWAHLLRRYRPLLDLSDVVTRQHVVGAHTEPVEAVDLRLVIGSEGRTRDFDRQWRPLTERLRHRWVGLATLMLAGGWAPAIELIELGGRYFVRDGHHRVSVARALHYTALDATVTHWVVESPLPWQEAVPAGRARLPLFRGTD
jgi:hypothetical protein